MVLYHFLLPGPPTRPPPLGLPWWAVLGLQCSVAGRAGSAATWLSAVASSSATLDSACILRRFYMVFGLGFGLILAWLWLDLAGFPFIMVGLRVDFGLDFCTLGCF